MWPRLLIVFLSQGHMWTCDVIMWHHVILTCVQIMWTNSWSRAILSHLMITTQINAKIYHPWQIPCYFKLESAVDWAITVASQNTQRNFQRQTSRSRHQHLEQDNSPIESLQSQPPVIPDPVVPRINQANQAEPIYPTVRGPPVPVPARQHSTSSKEADFLETHVPAYCYYPENIYLGNVLRLGRPSAKACLGRGSLDHLMEAKSW